MGVLALQINHALPDSPHGAHRAYRAGNQFASNRLRNIHPVHANERRGGVGPGLDSGRRIRGHQGGDGIGVVWVNSPVQDGPGGGAVHRTGVQVGEAEARGDGLTDR